MRFRTRGDLGVSFSFEGAAFGQLSKAKTAQAMVDVQCRIQFCLRLSER